MSKKERFRSDLIFEKNGMIIKSKKKIIVEHVKNKNYSHSIIKFSNNFSNNKLINILESEIKEMMNLEKINKNYHVFVVGIGNDSHTADSVGPKVLKHVKVNTLFANFDIDINGNRVSTLEPGVLGETGIDTCKIIKSVVQEIKPDIVIVIDSIVAENIENLNSIIEITNEGITPGSGVKIFSSSIDRKELGVPVISIGVATAVEINKNGLVYLLSRSDIDKYVKEISQIIGEALNKIFYK